MEKRTDNNRAEMIKKDHKRSLYINILVIFGILVVINLISINLFQRVDFSQGRIYSLTRSSRETVAELPDRLVIKAYFSRNLPPQLADAHRYTRDILAEYQAYSRGRVRFEFIDPSEDESYRQEAQRYQISPVSMRVIEDDKLEIREIFMGLLFQYQGQYEAIPFIQNTRGLEYEITSAIKKITDIGRKRVGLFKIEDSLPPLMQQQRQQQSYYQTVTGLISDHYDLLEVDLMDELEFDLETLIVTGIQDSLHLDQLYNLDQFIMRGGKLILFQDRINADLQNMQAYPINSNFFDLMEHYGISFKQNIVTDANAGQIQVQRQQGIFSFATPVNYPPFPIIQNMNRDNIIVRNLERIQTIFPSELIEPFNEKLEFIPLLMTSNNSGEIRGPMFDISFEKYMQERNLQRILTSPGKVVGAIYRGEVESRYLEMFPAEDDPRAVDFHYRNPDARFIVVADSDFIMDGAGAGMPSNLDFVLNSIDYMMDDTALIEIRARETIFRPLKEISTTGRKLVRWLNILLPSFVLILIGAIIYHKQLQKRKLIRKIYEQE